jgi:threonine dehydratase
MTRETMTIPPLDAFVRAAERIRGSVHVTPVFGSRALGAMARGATVRLKCESFQKTGSFKARGALNAIGQLSDDERARGVITVSAGNHAQALAWAARERGVPCTVVMPAAASETKAAASAGYGAEVIRHGVAAEAFVKANAMASERGLTFIHPFDDARITAGAGTTGLEILEQAPDVDVVIVPIGGGGLISGVAAAIKQAKPTVRVYGVEPEGAPALRRSLDAGHAVRLDAPSTIADGLAAPFAGELPFEVVRRFVEDVVLVTDAQIVDAMRILLARTKLLAEPAGAASTAALLADLIPDVAGKTVVPILSGANVDLDKLGSLLVTRS